MTRQKPSESTGDGERVGPDLTHAAIVVCCILGLVLVAGFLPAIDNVGAPGVDGTGSDDGSGTDERQQDRSDEDDGETDDDELAASPSIDVEGATPGNEMIITVEYGDEPEANVPVTVDGERVGTTDQNGEVSAAVPYEDSLTVTAEGTEWSETQRVGLATSVDVEPEVVDADDETLTVQAGIDGVPVADAPVFVDGERVETTDDDGRATVSLESQQLDVAVERGAADGRTSLDGGALDLSVEHYVIAPILPGSKATATVTVDGVPVGDATVTVDGGDQTETTDSEGTTPFDIPLADATTIETSVGGQTESVHLEGLAFKLAWSVLGTLSLLTGGIVTYLRLFDLEARRRHRIWVREITWEGGFVRALRSLTSGLAGAVGSTARTAPSLLTRLRIRAGWFAQFGSALRLPRLSLTLASLAGLSALSLLPSLDRSARSIGDDDDSASSETDDEIAAGLAGSAESEDVMEPVPSVRRAWHELVDRLGVYRRETRTPGQIARRAVDEGYPDDAVERLVASFRDVEYGGRQATEERVREAYAALDRIRSESGEDG
jgi:hypothetical protein